MCNEGSLHYSIADQKKKAITQQQILLVQKTWKLFRDIKPEIIGDVFYSKLFADMPALKRMFKNSIASQYKKLIDMLSMMVGRLHNLQEITPEIEEMALRHVGYGVKPAHYKLVEDALLWTLERGLGNDWNEEVKKAWTDCYTILSGIMIEASDS
ncbi:MAG: globin family protein [Bacteroidota bacterium]